MTKPTRPSIRRSGTYSQEFREEAVRYWLSSCQTLAAVVADLGLTPETLRSWRKQLESGEQRSDLAVRTEQQTNTAQANSAQELALARQIGQLKKELEAMTRQRDILKKAISIFSEDKMLGGSLR